MKFYKLEVCTTTVWEYIQRILQDMMHPNTL